MRLEEVERLVEVREIWVSRSTVSWSCNSSASSIAARVALPTAANRSESAATTAMSL